MEAGGDRPRVGCLAAGLLGEDGEVGSDVMAVRVGPSERVKRCGDGLSDGAGIWSWWSCSGKVTLAPKDRAMSSRRISIGAMYAVLFRGDHASTCAHTRSEALSMTQAPESPPTGNMLVTIASKKRWMV